MDSKKTIKNIVVLLICLFGIALIVLNIHHHQQIRNATGAKSPEISVDGESTKDNMPVNDRSVPNESAQNPTFASGEGQTIDNEAEELVYQLDAAEEELDMIQEQLADDEAKKAEQRKIQRELQKRYREDPSYEKSMRRILNTRYADLFKKLNLSPEELEKFKDLLVEELTAQEDIYLDYDDTANLSTEQQEERQQRYTELDKIYESKKEDLLGEVDYKIYRAYTETQSERYNVNAFTETLDSGERLTETQKEELIEAMNEELKNVTWERADDSESLSDMYSEKNMARMLANYDRRIDAYSKAAGSVLSASQLDQFNAYLQKERDQYKLIMEMSALRYGSSSAQ